MSTLLIVCVILAIPLVVALFVKKEYSVESEIKIDRPNPVVFEFLKYLKNHERFSKWGKADQHIIRQYQGTDGTVGFIASWESPDKQVGKGEQEIKKIALGRRIDFELRFIKPFATVAHSYLTTDPMSRNETVVIWGFDSRLNYPMNLLLLFNVQKKFSSDLSEGLERLKQELEKKG